MSHPLTPVRRIGQVMSISLTPTPTVEVAIGGDPSVTVFVPFLNSYQPIVNDYVILLGTAGDYVAIGCCAAITPVTPPVTINSGHTLATTSAGGSIGGIAHGLSGTPLAVITNVATNNTGLFIRISARTATTFDVNIRDDTNALYANTSTSFDWIAML